MIRNVTLLIDRCSPAQLPQNTWSTSVWTTGGRCRNWPLTSPRSADSSMAASTRSFFFLISLGNLDSIRNPIRSDILGTSFYVWAYFSFIPQIHLSISQGSVSLSVDCQRVGERPARPLGSLPTDGFEMLGKLMKTRGPNSGSVPVITSCRFY